MRFRTPLLAAVALAALVSVAGAAGAWAQDEQGGPPSRERAFPRAEERAHRSSMSDSVRRVRNETGGQVLSVERMQYDGRDVTRIKVVDDEGRVRIYMDDPQPASEPRRPSSHDDNPPRRRGDD